MERRFIYQTILVSFLIIVHIISLFIFYFSLGSNFNCLLIDYSLAHCDYLDGDNDVEHIVCSTNGEEVHIPNDSGIVDIKF
jgi:hypothetical protein